MSGTDAMAPEMADDQPDDQPDDDAAAEAEAEAFEAEALRNAPLALVARDVHVHYRTEVDRKRSKGERISFRPGQRQTIRAVNGVDLELRQGECLGIVGSNGSGKSTLLVALAGLMDVAEGEILASAQPALLGVGAVLNGKLSGRRNIELGCLALGMTRAEVAERMPDIVAFTGLGDAINRPLRGYSSGMRARLAFTVATQMTPEILFIDEALAVGDRQFRLRAAERLEDIRDDAGAIILVSHNVNEVSMMCTRVAWMDDGEIVMMGDVEEVLEAYAQANPSDKRAKRMMRRKAREERKAAKAVRKQQSEGPASGGVP